MGTLSSELAPQAERLSARPRVYVDANVSAGLVSFMRSSLGWDVLFVIEDRDLRRASDLRHYQLAHQLRRTLITLDRDYLDDRRFPPGEGSGVLVLQAPSEREFRQLLIRVGQILFSGPALPLERRKLHVHTDWGRTGSQPDAAAPVEPSANAEGASTV